MREELLGYLLEALDTDERERLEHRLSQDQQLQRELELLHESLEPLRADPEHFAAPPGLAQRTCSFISHKLAQPVQLPAPLGMGSGVLRGNWSLADLAVAAGIFLAASTLLFPALQHSRDNARIAGCQNNLRQLGTSLARFSQSHGDYFPSIPSTGNLAAAGMYAVELAENELLPDPQTLLCPNSSQAEEASLGEAFHVPSRSELEAASGAKLVNLEKRMGGSYGYNLGFVQDGVYRTVKNQGRSKFAMMADTPSMDTEGRRSKNHRSCGHNVLYEDGHVQFQKDCVLEDVLDHIYLNDDGMMAAGTHADDSVIGPSYASPMPRLISHDGQ